METADPTVGPEADSLSSDGFRDGPQLVFDRDDPTSVINMVAERMRQAMLTVPPELYDLTEGELRRQVKPTSVDHSLRVSFWREYEKCVSNGKTRILMPEVFGGICTEGYFYKVLQDPAKVAWLARPVQAYAKEMEAILLRGTQRLWDLIEMDIEDKDGKVNVRKAELWMKVYQEVGNRAKGMAVQRIKEEKKSTKLSLRANVNVTPALPQDMATVRRRIAEIEGRVNGKPPEIVEAEAIESATPLTAVDSDGPEITLVGVDD